MDNEDLDEVRDLLLKLPKSDDVEQLKEYIVTNIENFRGDNTAFHKDFDVHKEIIRRYDEVLSQKVSKVTLIEDLDILDRKIIRNFESLTKQLEKTNSTIGDNKQAFEDY